jgi:hypothetical protein
MKLFEVTKQLVDWNAKTEKQQIAMVRRNGWDIERIINPSEAVQLAAVNQSGHSIRFIIKGGIIPSEAVQLASVNQNVWAFLNINRPSPQVIKTALTNQRFIKDSNAYEQQVKKLFANNALLMNKWLRYGETMRNQQ